jgi:hypothetical protein
MERPHFPALLADLRLAAELDPRLPPRLRGRHARADIVLDEVFEMEAQLLVQLALHPASP